MFKINRKIEYSLMALKHMNAKRPGELTTAKEICQAYHAPFDATARALQIMAQKGLLRAEHGAHGGYLIQKDLDKVSFLELCEWILGPVTLAECLMDHECSLTHDCNIISPMLTLNQKMKEFYRMLPLRQLIDFRHHDESRVRQGPAAEPITV
jgi:Rrf2 family protein